MLCIMQQNVTVWVIIPMFTLTFFQANSKMVYARYCTERKKTRLRYRCISLRINKEEIPYETHENEAKKVQKMVEQNEKEMEDFSSPSCHFYDMHHILDGCF